MNLQSIKQRFGIIGRSEKLDRALSTAIRVASTDLTTLIQGESGVGKEVFSRIIHSLSKRKHNNFIAINCGAIPEGTINSELFGHEKGAFTGATSERKGYFETVGDGTIFLDEIGEMPLDTQAYLLRILESGEYIKVGSSKVMKTDVRVVAATNINLEDHIRKGKFREDLFYRLNTVPIYVPALRERENDIYMLFRKFSVDFAEKYRMQPMELDEHAKLLVKHYAWPGNVRELKNLVEQISILSENKIVDAETILTYAPKLKQRNLPAVTDTESNHTSFEEREILYKVLFDMKTDLNDLKALIYELVRTNDLSMPDVGALNKSNVSLPSGNRFDSQVNEQSGSSFTYAPTYEDPNFDKSRRAVIIQEEDEMYSSSEVIEESLSLEEMEKDFIKRALKKYRGRRKEAAEELGISERTLYRKIKQYEIDE